ncbi:MAG: hypothetical protein HY660_15245 [Armatimonadetes bacterium]|nr:hypothetical protein [Armatimonadota bacterium]
MRMLITGLLLGILITVAVDAALADHQPSGITAYLVRQWKPDPKTIEGTTGGEFLGWSVQARETYITGAIAGIIAATDYMKSLNPSIRTLADAISKFGKTDRYYAQELEKHLTQYPNDKNIPVMALLYWVRDHEDRR